MSTIVFVFGVGWRFVYYKVCVDGFLAQNVLQILRRLGKNILRFIERSSLENILVDFVELLIVSDSSCSIFIHVIGFDCTFAICGLTHTVKRKPIGFWSYD